MSNQHDISQANKTAYFSLSSRLSKYTWMHNKANNMSPSRSCGEQRLYDSLGKVEKTRRDAALTRFDFVSGRVHFYQIFPPANTPDDLPEDLKDIGRGWVEKGCLLVEKTKGDPMLARRLVGLAVQERTNNPGAVVIAEDFVVAREIAIREEGIREGRAQVLRENATIDLTDD